MSRLQEEFEKHPFALRRQFNRLDEGQKLLVIRKFNRHAKACDASECELDPRFLWEVIEDVKKGLDV